MTEILWDVRKRERLRKAYHAAVLAEADEFEFDGHGLVTNYAKYLLQYLDSLPLP